MGKLTISVSHSGGAVDVKVVTIVAGVTRQLQTLLNRSCPYVSVSRGGTGKACFFCGVGTEVFVASREVLVAGTTVALL
jgi:hypothetical protein